MPSRMLSLLQSFCWMCVCVTTDCVSVCMSNQMSTFALNDPEISIWRDFLYNSNADEWIEIIRTNIETKHGILSLVRINLGCVTQYNIMRDAVARYRVIQSYIIKLMLRGN